MARFLWCWPDVNRGSRYPATSRSDALAQDAFSRISELAMDKDQFNNPEPRLLHLTTDAEDALEEFAREMALRAHEASGVFAGALGKARGHMLRLANIIEHL